MLCFLGKLSEKDGSTWLGTILAGANEFPLCRATKRYLRIQGEFQNYPEVSQNSWMFTWPQRGT
jgi:hypothetical protein